MTDERWKRLFSAFAKMSLWDGIDESKNQKAKKESYSIITGGHTKDSGLSDSLAEYELVAKKKNPVYRAWNAGEDSLLKGLLWTANNVAYYDQKWGLLDPVKVEITYTKKF